MSLTLIIYLNRFYVSYTHYIFEYILCLLHSLYIIYIINISLITEQRKLINTKRVCAVKNCIPDDSCGESFHRIPTRLKEIWIQVIGLNNLITESANPRICSKHFDASCYKPEKPGAKNFLKRNAVPTGSGILTSDSGINILKLLPYILHTSVHINIIMSSQEHHV